MRWRLGAGRKKCEGLQAVGTLPGCSHNACSVREAGAGRWGDGSLEWRGCQHQPMHSAARGSGWSCRAAPLCPATGPRRLLLLHHRCTRPGRSWPRVLWYCSRLGRGQHEGCFPCVALLRLAANCCLLLLLRMQIKGAELEHVHTWAAPAM